jgi:hypothetical protein
LVKTVMLPVLVLWFAWLARPRAARTLALHLLVVAALTAAAAGAFFSTAHPLAPFASLGGLEFWASPSHLVASGAQTFVASFAGTDAADDAPVVAEAALLLLFVFLLWRLARRVKGADARALIAVWGVALLLLALSLPYLLPWYAAWFVPFLAFLEDPVLILAGVFASIVLAFTLVPADPFHGLTTRAVMDGVHYGAAPFLLLVLVLVAARLRSSTRGGPEPDRRAAAWARSSTRARARKSPQAASNDSRLG